MSARARRREDSPSPSAFMGREFGAVRHVHSFFPYNVTDARNSHITFDYTKVSLAKFVLTLEPTTFAAAPEQRLRTVTLRVCRVSKHVSIALP